jgi:glycosyltransferase involved in cell wall biosynthesis
VTPASPVVVLHVLACDELAGTELMVASVVVHSPAETVSHELATLAPPGPIAARVAAGGRQTASLGGRWGLLGASYRLGRLLRSRRYDVVNAYGLKASVVARVLARFLQRRAAFVCGVRNLHVTTLEQLESPKARIAALVERLLSPLVDVYDANSRAALDILAGLGIHGDRLVYVPNGLDLSRWTARAGEPEDQDAPLILCAARFVEAKRQQDLLRALAVLRSEGHSFRTVLAGEGPTRRDMQVLASRLGLDAYVEFPGTVGRDRMRALLEQAAMACLPSAWEGMPGSLMEAMATGVPVVSTDVSGTNELVVSGESGLLVPAYDPPALARALAALLTDRGERARLAAGGRRRMEERFSLDVMLEAKERLYLDVSRRGRGA